MDDYYATHTLSRPNMKPFDLKAGDIVKTREETIIAFGKSSYKKGYATKTYKVVYISKRIFIVEDVYGGKSSFMKKQYQMGEVKRVE